jgi:tetratricopeptide (TPR) repeat protein
VKVSRNGENGNGSGDERSQRARELLYQALEDECPKRRSMLARRAVELDPDCAEAYLILADDTHDALARADLLRQGVDAGERALGESFVERESGNFWLLLETRPYMRARLRLARELAALGLKREALAHFHALLDLDTQDNLGVRTDIALLLLDLREHEQLEALLERYNTDTDPTFFPYVRALLSFRQQGDGPQARELMELAVQSNPHVPPLLLGHLPLPDELPQQTIPGDEGEAARYARYGLSAWSSTEGALCWLELQLAGVCCGGTEETCTGTGLFRCGTSELGLAELPTDPGAIVEPALWMGEVTRRLRKELPAAGYSERVLSLAIELWRSFARDAQPRKRKAAVFAAAVETAVAELLGEQRSSRVATAKRYGIAPATLTRATRTFEKWMDDVTDWADPGVEEELELAATVLPLDHETLGDLLGLPQVSETWHGACRTMPFQILEPRVQRPTLAVWYEDNAKTIIGQELFGVAMPPHGLDHTLLHAMLSPLWGEPRRPRSVRVEDAELAAGLRHQLAPLDIGVECDDLPGINDLMASLRDFFSRRFSPSYFDGDVTEGLVGRFFKAAAALRRAAPWTFVGDEQVLGIRLDRWGAETVCVSVMGGTSLERGLMIFSGLDDYLQYYRHAMLSELDGALVGAPVEQLSLIYEAGAELDPSLRREVFKHGFEVVGATDYPVLTRVDSEGGAVPPCASDYQIATVCAEAVSVFCARQRCVFNKRRGQPMRAKVEIALCEDMASVEVIAPQRS